MRRRCAGSSFTLRALHCPTTDDGSYYHADLVGLRAITVDGADYWQSGWLCKISERAILLELAVAGSNETVLIPFRDQFVPDVDVKGGKVVIVPPIMIDGTEPRGTGDVDNVGRDDEE